MFKSAIETVAKFTRPIHTLSRKYKSEAIIPGAATLFFVNEEGYAITCKHVIDVLINANKLDQQYLLFKMLRQHLSKDEKYDDNLMAIEKQFNFNTENIVQIKNTFIDCVDTMSGYTWILHPKYDLAILKFNDFKQRHYSDYAVFKKNTGDIKQGEFMCRLGFPFPEFTNFEYDAASDDMHFTNKGMLGSPIFPIEGMLTRFLVDDERAFGIELSTPGLKGQSGGPLFDKDGVVCGMQFSTKHLHLGFDIMDKEILVDNGIKKVSDYSFMHLGQCIHVDVIKSFLAENNVRYYEEQSKSMYNFVLTK